MMDATVEFIRWRDVCILNVGPILICPVLSKVPVTRCAYKCDISSSNSTETSFTSSQTELETGSQDIQIKNDADTSSGDQSCSLLAQLRSQLPIILKHLPDSGYDVGVIHATSQLVDSQQDHLPSIETDSLERDSINCVLSPEDIFDRHVESLSDDVFETESDTKRRLVIDQAISDQSCDIQASFQSDESTHQLTSVSQTDNTTPESIEYSSSSGSFITDFEPLFIVEFENEVDRREEFLLAEACEKFELSTSSNGAKADVMSSFPDHLKTMDEPNTSQITIKKLGCEEITDCLIHIEDDLKHHIPRVSSDSSPDTETCIQYSVGYHDLSDDTKQCNSSVLCTYANDKYMSEQRSDLHPNRNHNIEGRNDKVLQNKVPCAEILHRNHETIEHKGFCEYSKCALVATDECINKKSDRSYLRSKGCVHVDFAEVELYIHNIIKNALEQFIEERGDTPPEISMNLWKNNLEYCNYQMTEDSDIGTKKIVYAPSQEDDPDSFIGTLAPIPEVDSILEEYISESVYYDISLTKYHPRYKKEGLQPIPEAENKTDSDNCTIFTHDKLNEDDEQITPKERHADNMTRFCHKEDESGHTQENLSSANFDIEATNLMHSAEYQVVNNSTRINTNDDGDESCVHTFDKKLDNQHVLFPADEGVNKNVKVSAKQNGSKDYKENSPYTSITKDCITREFSQLNSKIDNAQVSRERSNENLDENETEKANSLQKDDKHNPSIKRVTNDNFSNENISHDRSITDEYFQHLCITGPENENIDHYHTYEDFTKQLVDTNFRIGGLFENENKKSKNHLSEKLDENNYNTTELVNDSYEKAFDAFKNEYDLELTQDTKNVTHSPMITASSKDESNVSTSNGINIIASIESNGCEANETKIQTSDKSLHERSDAEEVLFLDGNEHKSSKLPEENAVKEMSKYNNTLEIPRHDVALISANSQKDAKTQSENLYVGTQIKASIDKHLPLYKDNFVEQNLKTERQQVNDKKSSFPQTDASFKAKMLCKILKSNLSNELGRRPEYRTHSRYQSHSLNLEDHQIPQTGAAKNRTQSLRKAKSLDLDYSVSKFTNNAVNGENVSARKEPHNRGMQYKPILKRSFSSFDQDYARNDYDTYDNNAFKQTVTGDPLDCVALDKRKLCKSKTLDVKLRPKAFGVVFNDPPKINVTESSKGTPLKRDKSVEKLHFENDPNTENLLKRKINVRIQETCNTEKEKGLVGYRHEKKKDVEDSVERAEDPTTIRLCHESSQPNDTNKPLSYTESDSLTKRRNVFKEGTFKVKRVTSEDFLTYERLTENGSSVDSPSTNIKDYIDAIYIENKFYGDTIAFYPEIIDESADQIYKDTLVRQNKDHQCQKDKRTNRKDAHSSMRNSRYRKSEDNPINVLNSFTDGHAVKSKNIIDGKSNRSKSLQRHQSFEKSNFYDNIGTTSNRVKTDQSSQDRTAETQDRSLINSPNTRGFNQNNGRTGNNVTKPGNTETVKKSSERPKCRSRDYVAAPLKRNKGRVNEMRIQEHLEKKQKDGPLSLTDAYGSMDTNDTHTGHALTNSANHLSESMTSLSNRHAPISSPFRQGTLNKQQSLQSSHSELNGEHRHEEGIKFERLKNLPEEELMVKIREIIGHMERLEDYHRGDGMRIQKMLGDMYWDYTHMREMIGDCMADNGYAVVSMTMLKTLNSIGIFKNDDVWFPTYYTYNTMWNFTDASSKLAKALSENDAVRLLTLNCGHKPYINAIHSKNVYYVIKASLSILHNIARNSGMKHLFDENKTSETIMPFLESEDEMLKILATLTIANIVDEEENKTIIAESGTIHDIVNWIEKALSLPRRRYKGFTPQELTEGLNKLAVNDANKMRIVDEGALQMFLQMLQHDDIREQSSAARIVWTLSFDKDVRLKINENTELVSVMEKLTDSTNKSLQTNCSGALWVIRGENEVNNEKRPKTNKNKSHVFLSYAWSDKEIVLNIRDRLRAEGYAIWIDIEKMGKATLETMTEAIENSAVVLVCMSEKYKQSPNCRTEAEYTFQLKKDYIPLMMQKKYRPDGWVGTILGAKLYFDFSGKYPFDKSFQGLLKELRGRGKVTPNTTPGDSNDHTDSAMVHSMSLSSHTSAGTPVHHMPLNSAILNMGQEDLIKWLRNVKLTECIPAFMEFDGRLLMQLKIMRTEAPEFFYQCLEKRLNMSLIEILKFTRALEELQ